MTYKQVRDNFVQDLAENAYLTMRTAEEMELAISALEKQIPKKPISDGWGSYLKLCPNCKSKEIYDHDIEVVGNIHDNPELLGGADNGKV